jgi:hypothetical protein
MTIDIEYQHSAGCWTVFFNGDPESDHPTFTGACQYAAERLGKMLEADGMAE